MQHRLIRTAAPLAVVAALALAGCKQEPETMNVGTGDPMSEELANAAPVELPPMLKASHTYRCKDNSLVYLDIMTDDKTVNFKTDKAGPITVLKAPEAGQPFVSPDGKTTLVGNGDNVTVNGTACKVG